MPSEGPPRPVPWNMSGRNLIVSYTAGEGADAGVGVAVWSDQLQCPEAGRIDIPPSIRGLWAGQRLRATGMYHDIQEVEAIGPLLVMSTWPHLLKEAVWLHFIDSNAALACLIKGSSTCLGTATLVGMTWHHVGKLQVLTVSTRRAIPFMVSRARFSMVPETCPLFS